MRRRDGVCRWAGALALAAAAGCAVPTLTEEGDMGRALVRAELLPGGRGAVVLENRGLRVAVVPSVGGKILSIQDRRSGREWLWQNPHVRLRPAALGAAYGDYDLSGWDECFPSVGNVTYPDGEWQGVSTGDHGEVWCRPWDTTVGEHSIVSSIRGAGLPYTLTREIRLVDERTARFAYTLGVDGEIPLPALWAGHALFAVEPGMRILFPQGTTMRIRSEDSHLGDEGELFPWPLAPGRGTPVDLSKVPPSDAGWHAKLFTHDLPEPWARLEASDGSGLTLRFPDTPCIGLWLNYGRVGGTGQPPHVNVGIEPTTAAGEHPLETDPVATVAGETRWVVTVELD